MIHFAHVYIVDHDPPLVEMYSAECQCGWLGPVRVEKSAAQKDAANHAKGGQA